MLVWLKRLYKQYKLKQLRKKGLQIADDCNLVGMPNFGSEPYLISIGRHVRITSRVTFITHDGGTFCFNHQPEYRDVIRYGRITIYDNCVIGYGTTILPGVSIGPNSIVGAGSVVTRDVPANSIAAGNPAKVLSTMDDYIKKCAENNPRYDRENYRKHKIGELLKLYPYPW